MSSLVLIRRRAVPRRRPVWWGWLYKFALFGLLVGACYQLVTRELGMGRTAKAQAARFLSR